MAEQESWLEELRSGSPQALEALLTDYGPMMGYVVRGILSDPHQAEECLAQVYARLVEKAADYDGARAGLATWLTAICRNAAYDRLRALARQGQRSGELDPQIPDPSPGPEETVLRRERVQALELARCAQAVAVRPGQWQDDDLTDDLVPQVEDDALTLTVGETQAELSSWLILLPEGQARWYHWFRYEAGSGLRLQEQFSVDGSSHHHTRDFTGALFWTAADQVLSAHPQVRLAGGETAEELPEWSAWINQEELERFGQLHFSPYFSYSLPADAETVWGCLSYTLDLSAWQSLAGDDPFYDSTHVFLRRQTQLLHYPFADIHQLGGARQTGQWGPIQTAYGTCWYNE